MPKSVMVIPSCRPKSFAEFVTKWSPFPWDLTILVEDNPTQTIDTSAIAKDKIYHYCWSDIDDALGDKSWIISRRDSAIRSFGFMVLSQLMQDMPELRSEVDLVISLDDDCYPLTETHRASFVDDYRRAMQPEQWTHLVPGMRTRGLPYTGGGSLTSHVHVGLWHNIPDFDSLQTLSGDFRLPFVPPSGNRLIHPDAYFPFCGMNFAFRPEALPFMYFPKMGEGSPYARFDDMWCGTLLQKLAKPSWRISVGEPHVWHDRASNVMVNLTKEAPGIRANEVFWKLIDGIPEKPDVKAPSDRMAYAGEYLEFLVARSDIVSLFGSELDMSWLRSHGHALQIWANQL